MQKKGFTLVELLAVIIILGVLTMVVIPSVFSMVRKAKDNAFNVLMTSIETNARLYVSRHQDEVDSGLDASNYYTLTLQDLSEEGLLKTPIKDPRSDEEISLTKKVVITRLSDQSLDICYEDRGCYVPVLLADELTKASNIVAGTTEGLHYNDSLSYYYYAGSNPKNWLLFNNYLWRIVEVNTDDTVKVIFEGTKNGSSTTENGLISTGTYASTNSNDYNAALTIKSTLQTWYNTNITSTSQNKVLSPRLCISKVSYSTSGTSKDTFLTTECGTLSTENLAVGLLQGSEYLMASLDSACLTAYKTTGDYGNACKNSNYLYKSGYNYWTITGDGTTTNIWPVTTSGALGAPIAANGTSGIRPVVSLKSSVVIDRGDGSFDNPYTLKDIVTVDTEKPVITITGSNPATVSLGSAYSDAGATATDNVDGNLTSKIITTSNVNTNVAGAYTVTYTVSDAAGNRKSVTRNVNVSGEFVFNYTGNYQTFTVPISGTYQIELWGAKGGNSLLNGVPANKSSGGLGGSGSYTEGTISLSQGSVIYVYVGGKGADGVVGTNSSGGYNGGGLGTWDNSDNETAGGGGGATDVRLNNGVWNDATSLYSRIMVAAGGGGGSWNGNGGNGGALTSLATNAHNVGSTQTSGYAFGVGRDGYGTGNSDGVGGGGGGYYGGTTADFSESGVCTTGVGGSSFISGYTGCNAVNASGTHTGQPNHYSGYVFSNWVMIAGDASMPTPTGGTETGHTNNGYAKLTFVH